MRQSVNLFKA